MKHNIFLAATLLILMGSIALQSCTKEPVEIATTTPDQTFAKQQYASGQQAIEQVSQSLQSINLEPLKSLNKSIKVKKNTEGYTPTEQALLSMVRNMLDALLDADEDGNYYHSWFYNITNGINTTLTLEGGLSQDNESRHIDSQTIETTFADENGNIYTITFANSISTQIQSYSNNFSDKATLVISQDDQTLLVVGVKTTVQSSEPRTVTSLTGLVDGFVSIQDHLFTLSNDFTPASTIGASMTYTNGGNHMITLRMRLTKGVSETTRKPLALAFETNLIDGTLVVSGSIQDIAAFANDGNEMLHLYANGTSQETSDAIVNAMNNNFDANLVLLNEPFGSITFVSNYDTDINSYRPELAVISTLFDDEPVTLSSAIDALGLSLRDIIDMIFNTEDDVLDE